MKNYIAIKSKKIRGFNYLHIFRITKNRPVFVTVARYQLASTRGEESEAMTALANAGEIAKKYKNTSLYYFPSQPFQLDIINPSHLDDMLQVRKAL